MTKNKNTLKKGPSVGNSNAPYFCLRTFCIYCGKIALDLMIISRSFQSESGAWLVHVRMNIQESGRLLMQ